jgi:signal transduction histidine kinase
MIDVPSRSPRIGAVLVAGFGLTLGLWIFAGYQFTLRMAEVERDAAAVNTRYMRAQELLATVRAQILLASVYVRDALLEANPVALEKNRRLLQETYGAIRRALDDYAPVLDSPLDVQDRIANLVREIDAFEQTMNEVLAGDTSRWPADARILLSERIVPQRELVIRLSEEVQALNRSAFLRQQDNIAAIYQDSQRSVWYQVGLALAASLGIALFATLYASRLERRIRLQSARDAQSRRDVQRLSGQLVRVQEDERRVIARELHDEVGQALTAIKVELAVAQEALQSAGASPAPLEAARQITDGALHAVRDLSRLLHPAVLTDLGLAAAIEWYARSCEQRYGFPIEVHTEGTEARLSPEVETAAYRIAQEALTNVARHARATSCAVRVSVSPEGIRLSVEDNGAGFDRASSRHGTGLGLIGIRERVTDRGGVFEFETLPGRGTRLAVTLPAAASAPAGVSENV